METDSKFELKKVALKSSHGVIWFITYSERQRNFF